MQPDSPLAGRRVVVTRPAAQSTGISEKLRAAGANVIRIPAFRVAAVEGAGLEEELRAAGSLRYDTVVFTSQNAVKYFLEIAGRAGVGGFEGVEVAAVGPATAEALERRGIRADLVGEPHTAEGLVEVIRRAHGAGAGLAGRRILYPKAADARDVIETELTRVGARVVAVTTYGAVPETLDDPAAAGRSLEPPPDVVTFASPSAAVHLARTLTRAVYERVAQGLKSQSVTACIGPVTEEVVRRLGYRVEIVADPHTVDGLVDAIMEHFSKER
jgi:uroporphyrinogen-III synthase